MNRFQGRENMLHYCTTCFHPTKSLNSVNVSGFKVHEPEESCDSSNIQNDTYTGGNCLNIWALPNFSLFFGFLVLTLFIHPCLEAPASSSTALTCSQQLWFLNTKELKKLNEKHNLFILGMSQLPEQHYWARCMFFFLKRSHDRPLDWT